MQHNKTHYFIPILTSQAGSCLTLANWQEIGIEMVSYYLDALLMKPGLSLLNSLPDLRSYCGWSGSIVLNASLLNADSDGIYTIRSRFDGSMIRIAEEKLFSLILKLQPDWVILSTSLSNYLIQSNRPLAKKPKLFIPEPKSSVYGSDLFYEFGNDKQKSIYFFDEFDLSQVEELLSKGIDLIESDKPANDAFNGQVYTRQNTIALLDPQWTQIHNVIDEECACPTCEQGFTKAYLHHLLLQTPLLAQRFLIQHNAYYYQHQIQSFVQTS